MVKFVSYDGWYPNLCSGRLILEIDGEKVEMERFTDDFHMCSGGSVSFDSEWNEHVTEGEWEVTVGGKYAEYEDEITRIINENIPYGCCGGCV